MLLFLLCLVTQIHVFALPDQDQVPLKPPSGALRESDLNLCRDQHFYDVYPSSCTSLLCSVLRSALPDRVSFPNDTEYIRQSRQYWAANQGELHSECRVSPRDAVEVQQILAILRRGQVSIATKAGGHSHVRNTSNIGGGITIDLEQLREVKVSNDQATVAVGAGATWGEVYKVLEPLGLSVAGARANTVGVAGYLLGGGLSIFQGVQGWAFDCVEAFEIVLPNATVIIANSKEHSELFRALKGGGSNFGIVTKFYLKTYRHSSILDRWHIVYSHRSSRSEIVDALVSYISKAGDDPEATVNVGFSGELDQSGGLNLVPWIRMTHPRDINNSPPLQPFLTIANNSSEDRRRISQYEMGREGALSEPKGWRVQKNTITTQIHGASLEKFLDEFETWCNRLRGLNLDPNIKFGMLLQPITTSHLEVSRNAGGNILGLSGQKEPLMLIFYQISYRLAERDDVFHNSLRQLVELTESYAVRSGAYHSFKYVNYAAGYQDTFAVLRENNTEWERVKNVQREYDPDGWYGRSIKTPFHM